MSTSACETLGLRPPDGDGAPENAGESGAVRGEIRGIVRVPGSKSIAQRAVVLAALAPGRTRLAGLPDGEDVVAALELVRAAGARVEKLAPAACAIDGRPPGPHRG